ncbi:Histone-lysine N-methyltransferase set9 [Allomyces javanicus]|nr:Histone-lysine N-methyltransferase set9 [Allomyces javanicus]
MSRRVTRASFRGQPPTTPASVPAALAIPVEETRRATRTSATQIKTAASKITAQQVGSVAANDDAPSLAASTATLANLNISASRLFDSSSTTSLAPAAADQSAGSKAPVSSLAALRAERIAARAAARNAVAPTAAARPADGMMRLPTHLSTARKQPNDAGSAALGGSTSTKHAMSSHDDGHDSEDSGSLMSVRSGPSSSNSGELSSVDSDLVAPVAFMNGQQSDKGTPLSVGTGPSSPVPYFAVPPSDDASSTSTTTPVSSSSSSEQRATDRLMQLAEVALGLGIHMGAVDGGATEATAQERTGLKQSTTSTSLSSVPTVASGPREQAVHDVVMEDARNDEKAQDDVPAAAGSGVAPMDVDSSPVASKSSSVLTSVRSSPLSSVPDHLFNDAGLDSSFSSVDDSDEPDDPDHRPSSRRLPPIEVSRKEAVEIGIMTLVQFAKCTNMKLTITAYAMARCPEPSFRDLAAYDDVCTHILLDAMYLPFRVLKMDLADLAVANATEATGKRPHHELPRQIVEKPTEFPVPADDIAVVLRNVAEGKVTELDAVHMIIDQTTWLKKWLTSTVPIEQIAHFCRHMRRYVAMYTPTAGFDVVESRRYESAQPPATNKLRQAALVATRAYKPGEVLKLCSGHALALTPAEEDALQDAARDFSVLHSSRLNAFCLFLGPGRFANHDCEPNIDFVIRRRTLPPVIAAVIADVGDPPGTTTVPHASEIYMRATREIRAGEELTVSYGRHYFDRNNAACLCETCERTGRGQFAPERRSKAPTPDAPGGEPAYASPAASSPAQSPPGSGGEEPAADASANSSVLRSPRMVRRAKVDARLHIRAEHKRDEPDMVGGLVVAPESEWDLDAPIQEGARLGSLRQFFHHVQDLGIGATPRPAPRVPAVVIPPKVTCYHCQAQTYTYELSRRGVVECHKCLRHSLLFHVPWPQRTGAARESRRRPAYARTLLCWVELHLTGQTVVDKDAADRGRGAGKNARKGKDDGRAPTPPSPVLEPMDDAAARRAAGKKGVGKAKSGKKRSAEEDSEEARARRVAEEIAQARAQIAALREIPPEWQHLPSEIRDENGRMLNLNERNLLLCEDTGTWYPAVSLPVSDWVEEGFAPSPEHIAVRYLHARDLQYGFVDFQHVYSVDQVLFEPEGIYLVASMQPLSSSSSLASSSSSVSTPAHGREVRMLLSVNQDRALRCIAMPTRTKLLWRKWADEMHVLKQLSHPSMPYRPVANFDLANLTFPPVMTRSGAPSSVVSSGTSTPSASMRGKHNAPLERVRAYRASDVAPGSPSPRARDGDRGSSPLTSLSPASDVAEPEFSSGLPTRRATRASKRRKLE